MKRPIARVTIELSRELGYPEVEAGQVVAWVETLMAERTFDGFNSCRYSEAKVVGLEVFSEQS